MPPFLFTISYTNALVIWHTVGGVGNLSYGCSGGRKDERCKCFSLRLMWRCIFLVPQFLKSFLTSIVGFFRSGGKGEIYAYILPNKSNMDRLLEVPPESLENPDYGFSVGRGAFKFPKGAWTTIAERVKLNTVGKVDGQYFALSSS